MKLKRYRLIFTAIAALALLATACSKIDDEEENGYNSATGTTVSVTLPIGIAEQETTAAISRTTATTSPEEGFTVSFGQPATTTAAATAPPATRTIAQALSNVWVLQFNASGTNVSTTNTGTLAVGARLTPTLKVETDCTIYIIANGPASGLTTSNPAKLADFEGKMLHTATVTNLLPLSGKITVTVVDLGNGKGKISLADASLPMVTMRRIHSEVNLGVSCDVSGYNLTAAKLYNVPVGAAYGWNNATTTFPSAATANFGYTSTAAEGMPAMEVGSTATMVTYKWYIGDNRRGNVADLTAQTDRCSFKAPTYSTFARITLTNSTNESKKIYYDIYLGSGDVTNFDVMRNHTYGLSATIKGPAAFHEELIDTDNRVSGAGFPI